VRENGRGLPGQSRSASPAVSVAATHCTLRASDAARVARRDRASTSSLRGFALDGRKREAYDLSNRCEVVLGEIAEEGEKIARDT
jgi:hypothetical protein